MRIAEDETGRRYLVLKQSHEASRVRDVGTGEERYVENDHLSPVAGESVLDAAIRVVPDSTRRVIVGVPDERALGLLVDLGSSGPIAVESMLERYDLCESDLNGLLAELRLADLIEAVDVDGRPGYALTGTGSEGLSQLHPDGNA